MAVKKTLCKEFIASIKKFPLSYQRKIIAPVEKMLKKKTTQKDLKEVRDYVKNLNKGPRLVTHIDVDGLVSAVMMCAINQKKYSEILYTDYSAINAAKFKFLETDDVVDLPQPRNPVIKRGKPVKEGEDFLFEDIVVNFWSDHHETGKRSEYKGDHVYDSRSPSCASLIYRHFLSEKPELGRFERLINGTDIVDSANYRTPEAPYDMDNPGTVLRLMMISRSQRQVKPGFREDLIRNCADPKQNWEDLIYHPLVEGLAKEALMDFKKYRKYIKPLIENKDGIILKVEKEKRPKGNGLKDRYYPLALHPNSPFLIDSFKAYGFKGYFISISENMLMKDENGNHPSQLNLGECMNEIIKDIVGSPDAGGHKGIGAYGALPAEHLDEVVEACKEVLSKEAKRIGY